MPNPNQSAQLLSQMGHTGPRTPSRGGLGAFGRGAGFLRKLQYFGKWAKHKLVTGLLFGSIALGNIGAALSAPFAGTFFRGQTGGRVAHSLSLLGEKPVTDTARLAREFKYAKDAFVVDTADLAKGKYGGTDLSMAHMAGEEGLGGLIAPATFDEMIANIPQGTEMVIFGGHGSPRGHQFLADPTHTNWSEVDISELAPKLQARGVKRVYLTSCNAAGALEAYGQQTGAKNAIINGVEFLAPRGFGVSLEDNEVVGGIFNNAENQAAIMAIEGEPITNIPGIEFTSETDPAAHLNKQYKLSTAVENTDEEARLTQGTREEVRSRFEAFEKRKEEAATEKAEKVAEEATEEWEAKRKAILDEAAGGASPDEGRIINSNGALNGGTLGPPGGRPTIQSNRRLNDRIVGGEPPKKPMAADRPPSPRYEDTPGPEPPKSALRAKREEFVDRRNSQMVPGERDIARARRRRWNKQQQTKKTSVGIQSNEAFTFEGGGYSGGGSFTFSGGAIADSVPIRPMTPPEATPKVISNQQLNEKVKAPVLEKPIIQANAPINAHPVVEAIRPTTTEGGQIAWHGTHANIDKFDMQYLGTGEGLQAGGHGLYFTENPALARWYQNLKAPKGTTGNLYKVQLPHANTMLDLNAEFKHQSAFIQERLAEFRDVKIPGFVPQLGLENPTGLDFYQHLSKTLGSDKAASEYLLSKGIRGNVWDDLTSAKGHRNFAVFNDADVEILEKNGAAVGAKQPSPREEAAPPAKSSFDYLEEARRRHAASQAEPEQWANSKLNEHPVVEEVRTAPAPKPPKPPKAPPPPPPTKPEPVKAIDPPPINRSPVVEKSRPINLPPAQKAAIEAAKQAIPSAPRGAATKEILEARTYNRVVSNSAFYRHAGDLKFVGGGLAETTPYIGRGIVQRQSRELQRLYEKYAGHKLNYNVNFVGYESHGAFAEWQMSRYGGAVPVGPGRGLFDAKERAVRLDLQDTVGKRKPIEVEAKHYAHEMAHAEQLEIGRQAGLSESQVRMAQKAEKKAGNYLDSDFEKGARKVEDAFYANKAYTQEYARTRARYDRIAQLEKMYTSKEHRDAARRNRQEMIKRDKRAKRMLEEPGFGGEPEIAPPAPPPRPVPPTPTPDPEPPPIVEEKPPISTQSTPRAAGSTPKQPPKPPPTAGTVPPPPKPKAPSAGNMALKAKKATKRVKAYSKGLTAGPGAVIGAAAIGIGALLLLCNGDSKSRAARNQPTKHLSTDERIRRPNEASVQ